MDWLPAAVPALMLLVCVPAYFYQWERHRHAAAMVIKLITTSLCLPLVLSRQPLTPFSLLMLAGLCFSILGDGLIGLGLIPGIISFSLAHICYSAAFVTLWGVSWLSVVLFILLAICSFWLMAHWKEYIKELRIPCTAYCLIISVMVALGVSQGLLHGGYGLLTAVGAIFFALSDLTLCRNQFIGCTKWQDRISLTMYYLGQLLLALGVYFI